MLCKNKYFSVSSQIKAYKNQTSHQVASSHLESWHYQPLTPFNTKGCSHQREREASSQKSSPHISRVNFPHLEKPFKTVFDSGRWSTQPQEWIKLQKIKRKSIPVFAPTLLSTPTPVFASTPLSTFTPLVSHGWPMALADDAVRGQFLRYSYSPHHWHPTTRPAAHLAAQDQPLPGWWNVT